MAVHQWCRVTVVGPDGTETATWVVHGPGAPDLTIVDALALLQLAAARAGGGILLGDVCAGLRELLDFVGLGREVGRQAEGREQLLRVEERVETGDPPM
jgi:hypothetical protein